MFQAEGAQRLGLERGRRLQDESCISRGSETRGPGMFQAWRQAWGNMCTQ